MFACKFRKVEAQGCIAQAVCKSTASWYQSVCVEGGRERLARSHDKNKTKGDKVAPRENQLARTRAYVCTYTRRVVVSS